MPPTATVTSFSCGCGLDRGASRSPGTVETGLAADGNPLADRVWEPEN